MPDELDSQPRHAFGVPFFFESKNAHQKIIIAGHLIGPTFPGGPNLWRDVLDNFRVPVVEPVPARSDIMFDGSRKPAIEPGEIDADDHIRFAFQDQPEKLAEEAAKFEIIFRYV